MDTPDPAGEGPYPGRAVDTLSVDELAEVIRFHNRRYFIDKAPIIPDAAFDRLTRRLASLAPDHPALSELMEDVEDEAGLFAHRTPMLSLDKAYDEAGVLKWARAFEGPVLQAPKIDGIAASLHYDEGGRLFAAVTRGDGKRGELFTANARFIGGIPARIAQGPAEIRGEVYLPLGVFRERFEGTFSNPRNTAAGAIKQKVPEKTEGYGLRFFAYSLREAPPGLGVETLSEGLAWTGAQGVAVVPHDLVPREGIEGGYQRWLAARPELDYELDGVVYSADRLAAHADLGETAHHPRWAIAYKFQGESGETRIIDIEWSVSRSGAITPVAHVEPITLSGASVSRCSLHNLAILDKLGANVGARVVAMRRGGVIPHIELVLEPGPDPVERPATCPVSGHPTVVVGDVLMCSAPEDCVAARLGSLSHYLKVAGIEGFGPKIITRLLEEGLVHEPVDFYRLTTGQLEGLDRLGRKSAENLIAQVNAGRTLPLSTFLEAQGIDDLGSVASLRVAETFGSLEAVREASEEALAAIFGLGAKTAAAIRQGLDARAPRIDALLAEVRVEDQAPPPESGAAGEAGADPDDPIRGRSFVFTGKLASSDRKTAQRLVAERGGTTPADVTRDLDYLVIGDEGSPLLGGGAKSSKQKKAEKLQTEGARVAIISETDFHRMLTERPASAAAQSAGPAHQGLLELDQQEDPEADGRGDDPVV